MRDLFEKQHPLLASIKNVGFKNINYKVIAKDYTGNEAPYIHIGGIAATIRKSKIAQCYSTGNIYCEEGEEIFVRNGAIGSEIIDSSMIINCYSNVDIYEKSYSKNAMVAGIIAWMADSTVENCYAQVKISAKCTQGYMYVGGINASGENGNVINCVTLWDNMLDSYGFYSYVDRISYFARKYGNISMYSYDQNAKKASTYKGLGWDFKRIWMISKGYPVLKINENH